MKIEHLEKTVEDGFKAQASAIEKLHDALYADGALRERVGLLKTRVDNLEERGRGRDKAIFGLFLVFVAAVAKYAFDILSR